MKFAVLFVLSITFRPLKAFSPVPEEEPAQVRPHIGVMRYCPTSDLMLTKYHLLFFKAKASSRRLSGNQDDQANSLILLSTLPLRAMGKCSILAILLFDFSFNRHYTLHAPLQPSWMRPRLKYWDPW